MIQDPGTEILQRTSRGSAEIDEEVEKLNLEINEEGDDPNHDNTTE